MVNLIYWKAMRGVYFHKLHRHKYTYRRFRCPVNATLGEANAIKSGLSFLQNAGKLIEKCRYAERERNKSKEKKISRVKEGKESKEEGKKEQKLIEIKLRIKRGALERRGRKN